jgi:hypothetical protein
MAVYVPTEVLLSIVPEMLEVTDINCITRVCRLWNEHKDRLEKEHVIACIFKLLPRYNKPTSKTLLSKLTYADVQYIYECAKELHLIEPCPAFWAMPEDWVETALNFKDEDYGMLYLLNDIFDFNYQQHIGSKNRNNDIFDPNYQHQVQNKTRNNDNQTIYVDYHLSGVLFQMTNELLRYLCGDESVFEPAMYNNTRQRIHLRKVNKTTKLFRNTLDWVNRVYLWSEQYGDPLFDFNRLYTQTLTLLMLDVLDTMLTTPGISRKIYKDSDLLCFLNSPDHGGLAAVITEEDFHNRGGDNSMVKLYLQQKSEEIGYAAVILQHEWDEYHFVEEYTYIYIHKLFA